MPVEKIQYYALELTVAEIAKLEGLVPVTLRRYYYQIGDIYLAVEKCSEKSRGLIQKIEYENGEMLPISIIAKREGLGIKNLTGCYKKTGDIFQAVKICKEKKKARQERKIEIEQNEKEDYYGKKLRLKEIAKVEDINADKLRRCFKQTGDVYKAIFMAKYQKQKERIVNYPGISIDLYDLSLLIGVEYKQLIILLNEGMSIAEIKGKYVNQYAGEKIQLPSGLSLLEFCVQNRLNYTYMYRAIHTYGKNWMEALTQYGDGNKNIPNEWIYEKCNTRFKDLGIIGVHQTLIIKDMSEEQISLEEAVERTIIRRNAVKNGIPQEWGEILYSIFKTREVLEKEFHEEIKINDNEMVFLQDCDAELKPQGSTNPICNSKTEQDDITH